MPLSNTRAARRQSVSRPDAAVSARGSLEARELQILLIARRTGRPEATAAALADLVFAQVDRWGTRA